MTGDKLFTSLTGAQMLINRLQGELSIASNEFVALLLELETYMDQLRSANQHMAQVIAERREMEKVLLASESRFRALVEQGSDIIMLLNRRGKCTYISPSVERVLGYRPADIEGFRVLSYVHPTDRQRIQQDFFTCMGSPAVEIPLSCRVQSARGNWRYVSGVACNRLNDPATYAIVINIRDVTERHQADAQICYLNRSLERKIKERTAQLQLAYDFEATLKRITDKVRDSLDEAQIMQTAVEELVKAIPGSSCTASIYDLDRRVAFIGYEYTLSPCSYRGRSLDMNAYPELYEQILQGQTFQLCSLNPNPERGQVAMLIQPISDDENVLGDLWLVNQVSYCFSEQDIKLVQQVANQCAIALRQSRLYQTSQAQVVELERLNRMKDDFLNTVSHELRTPMAHIQMASQMLTVQLQALENYGGDNIHRYMQILEYECDRELSLIDDLLDMARLEVNADDDVLELMPIQLQIYIPVIAESFQERVRNQQQQLIIEIPADLPPLNTYEKYLNRILTELLNNACKYTPPEERIVVSARSIAVETVAPDEATNLSPPRQLLFLQIRVTNTGVEIPLEERDRIFEKFYRIPSNDPWKHGGTGLGLALVKKLAERLKCNIQLESEQLQTSFVLQFSLNS
ncbi:ATP-binding protein [Floridanema evergladense]|uniref:histidine kinase n=1 Tax=Floridaenema evergladense BLCC-F167 TaxID=3153639 RepID=A0ABV4WU94_9CYAN